MVIEKVILTAVH